MSKSLVFNDNRTREIIAKLLKCNMFVEDNRVRVCVRTGLYFITYHSIKRNDLETYWHEGVIFIWVDRFLRANKHKVLYITYVDYYYCIICVTFLCNSD